MTDFEYKLPDYLLAAYLFIVMFGALATLPIPFFMGL